MYTVGTPCKYELQNLQTIRALTPSSATQTTTTFVSTTTSISFHHCCNFPCTIISWVWICISSFQCFFSTFNRSSLFILRLHFCCHLTHRRCERWPKEEEERRKKKEERRKKKEERRKKKKKKRNIQKNKWVWNKKRKKEEEKPKTTKSTTTTTTTTTTIQLHNNPQQPTTTYLLLLTPLDVLRTTLLIERFFENASPADETDLCAPVISAVDPLPPPPPPLLSSTSTTTSCSNSVAK